MEICSRCVLPETFPGIKFDEDGVCTYCLRHPSAQRLDRQKRRYLTKFRILADEIRSQGPYDVIMAYSGGKDSTYTLKLLREDFDLNVLAITLNNSFLSQAASANIGVVSRALGLPHLMVSPPRQALVEAFRRSVTTNPYRPSELRRASAICTTCMNLVKSVMLKYAIRLDVPLVAFGWSPVQAPIQSSVLRLSGPMIRQAHSVLTRRLREVVGADLRPFLLDEKDFALLGTAPDGALGGAMYDVHPLAFLPYDEGRMLQEITSLGWAAPEDTDANSTNCLLNAYASQVHQTQLGFHPYAFEVSGLVREGYLSRQEGQAKLAASPDPAVVRRVEKELGL